MALQPKKIFILNNSAIWLESTKPENKQISKDDLTSIVTLIDLDHQQMLELKY